jgi:4-amino-4-deoxy-L-arabinose transferase-like glycosyltransferase
MEVFTKRIRKFVIENASFLSLLGIITISFLVRGIYITANPVGLDEPFSIFHAQMGIKEIIEGLKGGNNPPLYEIILHYWIDVFGISSMSVRFPSLIFSSINVAFVFLIVRKFINFKAAVVAAILISFSSFHIYFSHEARVYSLFALITTISFYLVFQIISDKKRFYVYGLLFLCYLILAFSHYLGVFVVLLQSAIIFFYGFKNKEGFKKHSYLLLGFILFYSIYIPEFISRFLDSSINGTWLKPVENLGNLHDILFLFSNENKLMYLLFIAILWGSSWKYILEIRINTYVKRVILFFIIPTFFLTSYSIFFKIPFIWRLTSIHAFTWFFVISILSFILYVIVKERKVISYSNIILVWFTVPFLLFFGVSFYIPVFLSRYLVFIVPAFYILLSVMLSFLFKGRIYYLAVSIVLITMIVSVDNKNIENHGIDKTIQQVKDLKTDSNKIIVCPYQFKLSFLYHYDKNYFADYENIITKLNNDGIFLASNWSGVKSALNPEDLNLIFLDAHTSFLYPNNGIIDSLKLDFNIENRYEYRDSVVIYNLKRKEPLLSGSI